MNAARRNAHRRGWPERLYEPRPGYYVFRCPDGRVLPIGRVSLAHAKAEAIAANNHLASIEPTLVEKLTGAAKTIADVLPKMDPPKATNTARSWKSLDGKIAAALGTIPCGRLTVAQCAEFLDAVRESGKARSSAALRTRLVAVCQRAQQLGWMDSNPADVTKAHRVTVKRARLTFETWQAIYAKAPEVAPWLPRAMRLALVLGVDVMTLARLTRAMVVDDVLTFTRQKTGARVAVPTHLRLDVLGLSLADILAERTGVLSPCLVHHVAPQGRAKAGDAVNQHTISKAFSEARDLAGLGGPHAPSIHECRSLCKRLYEAQGGVDTLALLGHAGEKMGALYADSRGVEPVRVRISK